MHGLTMMSANNRTPCVSMRLIMQTTRLAIFCMWKDWIKPQTQVIATRVTRECPVVHNSTCGAAIYLVQQLYDVACCWNHCAN